MKCKLIIMAAMTLAFPIPTRSQSMAQPQANAAVVNGYAPGDPSKPFAPYNLPEKNAQGQVYCDVYFTGIFDSIINGVSGTKPPTVPVVNGTVPVVNSTVPAQTITFVSVAGTGTAPTDVCGMPSNVPIVPAEVSSSSSSSSVVTSPTHTCDMPSHVSIVPAHVSSSSSVNHSSTPIPVAHTCACPAPPPSSSHVAPTPSSSAHPPNSSESKCPPHNSHRATRAAEAAVVVAQTSILLPNTQPTPAPADQGQLSGKSVSQGSYIEDLFSSYE